MRPQPDLPAPIRRLLQEAGLEIDPPYTRRIFTNRDLALENVPVIGFDMDHTLAMYRQDVMEQISVECTVAKLIARGYPETLASVPNDPRFAIRGLMVDKKLGNVLKMDHHGYVGRAYHGKRKLAREDRKAIYRAQRLGQERERFAPVDTLFALPEVTLFADVVDYIDQRPHEWTSAPPSYAEAWQDVRACIDEAHRDGSIKDRIRQDPSKFIETDPELGPTLHKFRSAGKRLFLLTNSLFDYSDTVMRCALGDRMAPYSEWLAFFDWVVVGAQKPRFFVDARAFQEIDRAGKAVGGPKPTPQRGRIYADGNQLGLQDALGVHADEVLYVGDHIYGDIVRSKRSSGWRTALIVSELEHDLAVRQSGRVVLQEIESLHDIRFQLAEDISTQRHLARILQRMDAQELVRGGLAEAEAVRLLEETRAEVRSRLDRMRRYQEETYDTLKRRRREVDTGFNPYWGSLFSERQDTSRFGAQVEDYACVYTSRVTNFLYVSPSRYFHSPHGSLPHWSRG